MVNEHHFSLNNKILSFDSVIAGKINDRAKQYHDWFEIYYLEKGKCNYLVEDALYEVNAGDIALIPPHTIHKTVYSSASHSRLLLNLSENYVPPYVASLLEGGNYFYRNPKIIANIYSILKNIESEYLNWDRYSEDMINGYVHTFFVLLSRNTNYYKNESVGNVYVEKILNYIKMNFNSDITLAGTAKDYSISPEHLSRLFKKETGLNFNEYLTSIRLKHAELLLQQEEKKPISEIAYSCGFNDSNYFSHKFKNVYGISPLQFQKKYLRKN